MHIVVSVCTRDRTESLRRTLRSLAAVEANGIRWDVLVVDNGSQESPAPIIQEFRGALNLRMVVESRTGVSHARNQVLEQGSGTHLIFIDDDVSVPSGWLRAYADGFARYPEAAFFGGPIVPDAPGVSPERLATIKAVIPGAISALEPDCGEHVVTRDSKLRPWGANMAFRRAAVEGRTFDPRLGRRAGDDAALGEETTFIRSLLADGHTGVWLPDAHLLHHVTARRFSVRYLGRHCRAVGWHQGYTLASTGEENARQTLDWVETEIRKRRWRHLKTPLWASFQERSEALRDLEILRGFQLGLRETLEGQSAQCRNA